MSEHILLTLALVGFLGIVAQWLAWYIKLPSIIFLLFLGILAGPVTGFLNPNELLGNLLFPLVSIGIAVILFEGGLTLKLNNIKGLTRPLYGLLSIGIAVTLAIISISTHFLLNLSWDISLLFGALMTVTGPTVIKPLLLAVRPNSNVSNILHWEGVFLDVIGAILIVLIFQYIVISNYEEDVFISLLKIIIIGSTLGIAGAKALSFLLDNYLLPNFLHHVFTLMLVLLIFSFSNMLMHESGLLAVTLMGMFLANMKNTNTEDILSFKESLSILLISILFIILSARINLSSVTEIGWYSFILLIIVFITRFIAVFLSTISSGLKLEEKILLGWISPRGIIAAAISSLFVIKMEEFGYKEADILVPLTFIVILGTILIQGLTSSKIAEKLNIREPDPTGVLVIGSNIVARSIALSLKENNINVIVADSNWENISEAKMLGLETYYGKIISDNADDKINFEQIGKMIAITPHRLLNALSCTRFKSEFGSGNTFYIQNSIEKENKNNKVLHKSYSGRQLFHENVTFEQLSSMLYNNGVIKTTNLTNEFNFKNYQKEYDGKIIPLYFIDSKNNLHFFSSTIDINEDTNIKIVSIIYK